MYTKQCIVETCRMMAAGCSSYGTPNHEGLKTRMSFRYVNKKKGLYCKNKIGNKSQ